MIKKIFTKLIYIVFFLAFFYTIFTGFLFPLNVTTKSTAIFSVICAGIIALVISGLICWQAYTILSLEKELYDLKKKVFSKYNDFIE